MSTEPVLRHVEASGLRLAYRELGEGRPVLLLHGWPTSSFLWRDVMPPIAAHNRVIALDLPGFGDSAKPLDASYSFRFYERVLSDFLGALGIDRVGLAVHDLGGPIGLYWALRQPDRVERLALLNTVVYPQMSWAVVAFVTALRLPGARQLMTSRWGLEKAMRIGVARPERRSRNMMDGVTGPFGEPDARRALALAGCRLNPRGFEDIARELPKLTCPVRIVYGAKDRILPDVAKTMGRVQADLPQAELTVLEDCGHFLQEDRPDDVGRLLAAFFSA